MEEHLDASVDQEESEEGEYPFESLDHRHSCEDEDRAEYQCPEDAPEEHLVLVFPLHTEEGEKHQEHEKVVHRQRLLNQVARQELHRLLLRLYGIEQPDACAEHQRHGNPDNCHLQGLRDTDLMLTFLAKRLQVDIKHGDDQHIKQGPRPQGDTDYFHFDCKDSVN